MGHAHLFRAIFQRFLHPTFSHHSPQLAIKLQSTSAPNGTMLVCDVDFSNAPFVIRNVAQVPNKEVDSGAK